MTKYKKVEEIMYRNRKIIVWSTKLTSGTKKGKLRYKVRLLAIKYRGQGYAYVHQKSGYNKKELVVYMKKFVDRFSRNIK